ncbi:MAG TPA: cyanophycin synthetase, partial [Vicinamibacterales bacterium]|nr:cyanophycin synthetase [Vicinamibacterales bacterium]
GALDVPPSFFEATTAAAFEIFAEGRVDVAVLEVGLGGRLDATNVVDPTAAAITAIDFDHVAQLGPTLEAIAAEKAGVLRPGIPVVLAPNPPVARAVIGARCQAVGARLVDVEGDSPCEVSIEDGQAVLSVVTPRRAYKDVRLALRGRHQADNGRVAIRLLEELGPILGVEMSAEAVRIALEQAVWPARLELLTWDGHPVLLDAAHNSGGAQALATFIRDTYARRVPMIVAAMKDKAVDDMLAAFGTAASRLIVTAPDSPRAVPSVDLAAHAARVCPHVPCEIAVTPVDALRRAVGAGSPVVVAGSLYLAGEIRPLLS